MVKIIKTTFLIIFLGCTAFAFAKVPSFIKERRIVKTKSPAKIKETIAYELEALLTLSSDLIAFLAEGQRTMVAKMHGLVVPEKGDFFSDAKVQELDTYVQEIQRMHKELKHTEQQIKKQFKNLSKNFNT